MKNFYYSALMALYAQMPAGESCWLSKGKPVKATIIVILGSDLEAVYNGMLIYHYVKKVYDYAPMIYCCGAKHKFLPKTQAELSRDACIQLGASKSQICMIKKGDGIRPTLLNFFGEMYPKDEVVVYASAFRSHFLVKSIVEAYKIKESYFCAPVNPVNRDFRDEIAYDLRWGNFMNLGNQTLLVHEMIEFYGSPDYFVGKLANATMCTKLINKMRRKIECGRVEAYMRYLGFQLLYHMNKVKIVKAREHQMSIYQKRLKEQGFNY